MATILTRQKDGTMKRVDTGIDAAMNVAKKVVKTVAAAPGKVVDAVVAANDREAAAKKAKDKQNIERAFGSVANYQSINKRFPMP